MKDDVVPSGISPHLFPIEEHMGDESSMQVNHIMMDQLSDRVDKSWDIERHDESVYSWFIHKQVHYMRLTDTDPMLKEP